MTKGTRPLMTLFRVRDLQIPIRIDHYQSGQDAYCESCNLNITPRIDSSNLLYCQYCQTTMGLVED